MKKEFQKLFLKLKLTILNIQKKKDILNEIQNFYQNLYNSQNIPDTNIHKYLEDFTLPTLNDNQKKNIGSFITEKEIDNAIKEMNLNKSPGSDGLTAEFYKTFRTQLTPILTELFNNSFFQNFLPPDFKLGIITLIFKNKGSPDEIKNWRPISLLNLDYKILTKTFTLRLKQNITKIGVHHEAGVF